MATVSARFEDWATSGRTRVTILPESTSAVVYFPLALTGVTGEGPLSLGQHAISKPQGHPLAMSLAEAKGIGHRGLNSIRAGGAFFAGVPEGPWFSALAAPTGTAAPPAADLPVIRHTG
uniref:Uncharacterized protein n=1 Tax=Oncorhynchus tshawytscha TaxID=74940 RepID=A0AAZ3QSC2_ONCTS